MGQDTAFMVVPFQRVGTRIGTRQVFVFDDLVPARAAIRNLSGRVAGIALLERRVDEETGCDVDRVLEARGAVPSDIAERTDWTLLLN